MSSQWLNRREALYAVSQMVAWPSILGAAWYSRQASEDSRHQLPAMREYPRQIAPKFDRPEIVTDEQLFSTLSRVRLRAATVQPAKVNHIDHALRMWGHEIRFDDDRFLDGPTQLGILIDDNRLRKHFGEESKPLMEKSEHGILVRVQEGRETSSHVDHTLATLTEIGLPLSHRIQTRGGSATVGEMLTAALRTFSLNQKEFEWTALAVALYSDDGAGFCTGEGQLVTYDMLAERIMREQLGRGVCFGGHRLFTLTMLLRLDAEHLEIFSKATREKICHHLLLATRVLNHSQHTDGYWDEAWPGQKIPQRQPLWELGARLVATGHALEWWAMLPDESLLPPRENLVRASQWLVREIEQMENETIEKNFTFMTHAARAMSLWRGKLPAAAWEALNKRNAAPKDCEPALETNATHHLRRGDLWNDNSGAVLSIELLLLATLAVIGLLVGMTSYRDAIVQELGDSAGSIATLTQSFEYSSITRSDSFGSGVSLVEVKANTEGSEYTDNRDFCEAVLDAALQAPMCITFDATAENEQ